MNPLCPLSYTKTFGKLASDYFRLSPFRAFRTVHSEMMAGQYQRDESGNLIVTINDEFPAKVMFEDGRLCSIRPHWGLS